MADRSAVLIGGGITGVLIARELRLAGWGVTLLEAAHIGSGSSSRTAAGIRQQFSTRPTVRGMRYSVRFYKEFAAEIEEGLSPLVQSGYLFLVGSEAEWPAVLERVKMQREAGLRDIEALTGDDLHARFPWLSRDTLFGGTFCPSDGFLLPHLIYNDGARRARELGAQIVQNAPVTGASTAGGRLAAVHTPKGSFEADLFIDCTNAWTLRTARLLGAEELPVDPLKRYLWFLLRDGTMTAETLASMPLTIAPGGAYCRPENAETLMIGKKHAATPEPNFTHADQDAVEPHFAHDSDIDAAPFELWMELAEHLPPLEEFGGVTATTCGYYGTTPDHNPFFGFDRKIGGLIRMVGFSGHGAMFGPFSARVALALAEAGSDVDSIDLDGEPVSLGAFKIGRPYESHETMVI